MPVDITRWVQRPSSAVASMMISRSVAVVPVFIWSFGETVAWPWHDGGFVREVSLVQD